MIIHKLLANENHSTSWKDDGCPTCRYSNNLSIMRCGVPLAAAVSCTPGLCSRRCRPPHYTLYYTQRRRPHSCAVILSPARKETASQDRIGDFIRVELPRLFPRGMIGILERYEGSAPLLPPGRQCVAPLLPWLSNRRPSICDELPHLPKRK